jgi:tetratricopeptide (TPR) repeat protein
MIPKKLAAIGAVSILTIGIAGLSIITVRDIFFPKPMEKELRQTKSMLRNVFDKNKELTTEIQDLTEKHAQFLKEMQEKEAEVAALKERMEGQAAYVKTLTKKGTRLEKEVGLKPVQRDYATPRPAEPVEMAYPYRREGRPELAYTPADLPEPSPEVPQAESSPAESQAALPLNEALQASIPDAVVDTALGETGAEEAGFSPSAETVTMPEASVDLGAVSPSPLPMRVSKRGEPSIQRDYDPVRPLEPVSWAYPQRREGKLAPPEPPPVVQSEETARIKGMLQQALEAADLQPPAPPVMDAPAESPILQTHTIPVIEAMQEVVQTSPVMLSESEASSVREPQTQILRRTDRPAPDDEAADRRFAQDEKVSAIAIPAAVETPAVPKQPEPRREGGMTPAKAEAYDQQFTGFDAQLQQLREERAKTEQAWEQRIQMLEKELKSRVPPEEKAKMEKRIDELQQKSQKLQDRVKHIKHVSEKDRVDYLYNLGVAYTQAGLFDAAAEMYEKVLQLDPNDAASHYNLGIIYDEHLNRTEEGIAHYKTYLALSKDPKKLRQVETWIRLSQYKLGGRRESHFGSASKAAEHIFLTTPD